VATNYTTEPTLHNTAKLKQNSPGNMEVDRAGSRNATPAKLESGVVGFAVNILRASISLRQCYKAFELYLAIHCLPVWPSLDIAPTRCLTQLPKFAI